MAESGCSLKVKDMDLVKYVREHHITLQVSYYQSYTNVQVWT